MYSRLLSISYATVGKFPTPATVSRLGVLTITEAARVAGRPAARGRAAIARSPPMLDLIMLAVGLGFFALSVAYAYGCDRL